MIPPPFEVVAVAGGFTWRLLASCGTPVVYTDDRFPSDFAAADAARAVRNAFCEVARRIDWYCA